MKQRLILLLFSLALASPGLASTLPYLQINSPTNQPVIDATILVNASVFTVANTNSSAGTPLYETSNTLIYTNLNTGYMLAYPGFQFHTVTNGAKPPAKQWVNQGLIQAVGQVFILTQSGGSTVNGIAGGKVLVFATNIINSGTIDVGSDGVIHLEGRDVDLTRGTILGGGDDPFAGLVEFGGGGQNNPIDYLDPSGVTDLYWGNGASQTMSGPPRPLQLSPNPFPAPTPRSPNFQVEFFDPFFGLRRTVTGIPGNFGTVFNGYAYQQPNLPGTNQSYTVVFVATNATDLNYNVNVRFSDEGRFNVAPVVEFSLPETDAASGTSLNNLLYFVDRSQILTNSGLIPNVQFPGTAYRPLTYEIRRSDPNNSGTIPTEWGNGTGPNFPVSSVNYFPAGASNSAVSNIYSAYSVHIDGTANVSTNPGGALGRVEIVATNLNLSRTHIRAENYVNISTTNLIASTNATIDAPVVSYNITSLSNTFIVTNLIPSAVRRFNGTLSMWSGVWTNTVGLVTIQYHVVVVDATQLQAVQAVTTPDVKLRGTNLVANNILTPSLTFRIDSPALTFDVGNELLLNSSTIPNLVSSNFPNLNYFTNLGLISLAGEAHFGSDRPPYAVMVNRGQISASTISMSATSFVNTGTIVAQSGPLSLYAGSGKFQGDTIEAFSDITITGGDYKIRASTNLTFGALRLSITNALTDNGSDAANSWTCFFGFNLLTKPLTGDLLGTTINSLISGSASVPHVWAGVDRGVSKEGYSNNVAVGRLVLNASSANAEFVFNGAGTSSNAMYVDFLELDGVVSNNVANMLNIAPNMTIYFANANVPVDSIDGALNGRLRWVRNYVGANSSADVVLPSGQTIQVNVGLLTSNTIDSDNDGIVNANDLSPFDGVVLKNTLAFTNVPPLKAQISWDAAGSTVYTIQYTTTLTPPNWQFLLNYTNSSPTNGPVTVLLDAVPPGNKERYYRVLYNPGL